jgi:hypothetical protein
MATRVCPISKKRCDCTTPGCPLEAATRKPTGLSPDEDSPQVLATVVAQVVGFTPLGTVDVGPGLEHEAGRVHAYGAVPVQLVEIAASMVRDFFGAYLLLGSRRIPCRVWIQSLEIARAVRDGLLFHEALAASVPEENAR